MGWSVFDTASVSQKCVINYDQFSGSQLSEHEDLFSLVGLLQVTGT